MTASAIEFLIDYWLDHFLQFFRILLHEPLAILPNLAHVLALKGVEVYFVRGLKNELVEQLGVIVRKVSGPVGVRTRLDVAEEVDNVVRIRENRKNEIT